MCFFGNFSSHLLWATKKFNFVEILSAQLKHNTSINFCTISKLKIKITEIKLFSVLSINISICHFYLTSWTPQIRLRKWKDVRWVRCNGLVLESLNHSSVRDISRKVWPDLVIPAERPRLLRRNALKLLFRLTIEQICSSVKSCNGYFVMLKQREIPPGVLLGKLYSNDAVGVCLVKSGFIWNIKTVVIEMPRKVEDLRILKKYKYLSGAISRRISIFRSNWCK